ncbi:ligand-binding sensor domain-containing protein [Puia sp. P3]|uniref:ligand-binding sensor domain-containing protein n=1 Tax=Puia sp. P3 TaxID=3423952 RepID=UPI003D6685D1
MRFYFVACLLLGLTASSCYGQYYFKHYQADDGLAHNSVYSILQDRKGLMWIGTRGGLNRYDGYSFRTIANKENKFGSIGDNAITALAEDKKGIIWIGSGKGVFKYDPYKELLTETGLASQAYISHLLIDSANNLWFLANNSLYKYDQSTGRPEHLEIRATCIAFDDNMRLWAGNDDGVLRRFDLSQKTLDSVRIFGEAGVASSRSISKICPIGGNEVLVGGFEQGLKIYDAGSRTTRPLPLHSNANTAIYVRDIISAGDRKYWIATESGIYIYSPGADTMVNLRKRTGDPYAIADNAVYVLCKDNQGGIWAGTYFGGLNYFSKQDARFEKYYPLQGANAVSGDAVSRIMPDRQGNLWIGTEDAGINRFDPKTGKFTHYAATGKTGSISYPNIHGLLPVGNQLFIGPYLHGMEIMDMRTGTITDRFGMIDDRDGHTSNFVSCIYMTRDSTLLIGTSYNGPGLFAYDRQQKSFRRARQIPHNSYVFDILEDRAGTIWTGSVARGTFYYNPKTGAQGNIRLGDSVGGSVINEFAVHKIFEDSEGCLWFATTGGGLVRLSRDRKTIKRFSTVNGMPSNVVLCMQEDGMRRLWVSTLRGLVCLDLRTEKISVYTKSNGLITNQFNYGSACMTPDGKIYFPCVKGMIAFNPAEFGQKIAAPPIYITGFQINNREVSPGGDDGRLVRSILYTDTLVLTHDQTNFSIEFAALNYSAPEAIRYKYRMKGLDKAWTYLSVNRKAFFTDLAAGSYEFVVQAESNTGSWESKERRLLITVLPPVWKSNAAYVLYALILIAGLLLAFRLYKRRLERKSLDQQRWFEHEKEKEVYEAKIEFFTNITHEIQTPLTLIAGPIEWLMNNFKEQPDVRKSLLIADRNARRLVELTNQLLDFRKTEVQQFSLNYVKTDITRQVGEQIAAFRPEAVKAGIQLALQAPEAPVTASVDSEAFAKICSNLISNAVKYAGSRATVTIEPSGPGDKHLIIRFSNDGKGIPEKYRDQIFEPFFRIRGNDKPGTGIGLSLARSLTELHGGSLTLVQGNPDLVIFELQLPINQKFEFQLSSWKKIK